jgi:hypothetical protein
VPKYRIFSKRHHGLGTKFRLFLQASSQSATENENWDIREPHLLLPSPNANGNKITAYLYTNLKKLTLQTLTLGEPAGPDYDKSFKIVSNFVGGLGVR